jgi:hypothetical protein
MSKWEYEVLKVATQQFAGTGIDGDELQEKLNALGDSGWEISGVVPNTGTAGTTTSVLVILKRSR